MIGEISIDSREEIVLHLDSLGLPDTFLYKDVDEHTTVISQGSNDFNLAECGKTINERGMTLINEEGQTLILSKEILDQIVQFL